MGDVARSESLARPQLWPLDGDLTMFTDRRIERHQLPYFLQVFNRLTDKPIGFLGNVSEDGLMLISQLPMMVDVDFELRLKIPGADDTFHPIDLTVTCLWSRGHQPATLRFRVQGAPRTRRIWAVDQRLVELLQL